MYSIIFLNLLSFIHYYINYVSCAGKDTKKRANSKMIIKKICSFYFQEQMWLDKVKYKMNVNYEDFSKEKAKIKPRSYKSRVR